MKKHDVILTAIGVYSMNTQDPEAVAARENVSRIVHEEPHVLQMHGFYLLEEQKAMRFDVVVSFDAKDRKAVCRDVTESVQKEFPDYQLQITMDTDFAEE